MSEAAWWKSKKMMVALAHHGFTSLMALVGIIKFPAQAGIILGGFFGSAATVTVAHLTNQASVDRSQANSPNYPLPPVQPGLPPAVPPPLPPADPGNGMRL